MNGEPQHTHPVEDAIGFWFLRFPSEELEEAYRADHASRSVWPIRVMVGLLLILSLIVSVLITIGEAPRTVGITASVSTPMLWIGNVIGIAAMIVVVTFIVQPQVQQHLQAFLTVGLVLFLLPELRAIAAVPIAYGLGATVMELMTVYVLLRLRFVGAVAVGLFVTVGHLSLVWSYQVASSPDLLDAFAVSAVALMVVNVILGVASHQTERLDRLSFLGRYQATAHARELAAALHELESAQSRLLASERQAALGRLAAGVVHELNNPVASVNSTAQTLRNTLERRLASAPKRERDATLMLLDTQLEGTARLAEVAHSLKRFVDLDREGDRIVDLRESLRDAIDLLGPRLEGLTVDVDLPAEPVEVRCAPAGLNFAFFAVLENAANALQGSGRIMVRVASEGDSWAVDIEDSGPGVPELEQANLFQPGFVKKGARVRMKVGLPTALRAAEASGGNLSYLGTSGSGAHFRFVLPNAGLRPHRPHGT